MTDEIIAFIAGMGIMFLIGIVFLCYFPNEKWKQEAIERGYAGYVITNPKNGTTEFQWKTNPEKSAL